MFADVIANCTETAHRLQQQLNIVDQFCISTGMEVNLSKTQFIVFHNGGSLKQNERLTLRGEYGLLQFTPTLSWSAFLQKLACQARRSLYALYNYQKPFGHFNISQLFNLFDSMVKPVLTYGSQILGCK